MHVPPPGSSLVHTLKPILQTKRFQDRTEVTDVTEVIRANKIDAVLLQYFRQRPIQGFDTNGRNDDYIFYAQVAQYPMNAPVELFLKRPHITVFVERISGCEGIRALSINPSDFSFGPSNIKLTMQQHNALVEDLNRQFAPVDVSFMLYNSGADN